MGNKCVANDLEYKRNDRKKYACPFKKTQAGKIKGE